MRLHYSDTHEHVQVGDQTIMPDGMYIKIIAIYEHSGAILIEVLGDGRTCCRRGATADEIGADWRGGTLLERDTERFFGKVLAVLNEPFEASGAVNHALSRHDCQRLLDGLAALKRQLPLGENYAHEAAAIEELATRLGKV